ncbi:MAG: dihydrofolate reductase [Polyangiales bacterium]
MTARAPLVLVVAVARNGVIGSGGALPWRIPEDLKHFRRMTEGHAIVMGRKTWDEVGKPLPKRRNLVVSRQVGLRLEGAEVFGSLDDALRAARATDPEPRVIGGAQLFAEALPLATRVHYTEVDRDEITGDTYFPDWDRAGWRQTERRTGEDPTVTFVTWERE